MQYFFDTSAVVKIYHEEKGSHSVLPLYAGKESIILSELSKVEFLSTIYKKFRANEINLKTLEALRLRFLADASDKFTVIPVLSPIIDAAMELYEKYGKSNHLFSLDALQIATFTAVSDNDTVFVCADKRLTSFVKSLEFSVLEL